jgi:RNA polymerase sigma-70 factor (ECF subfamily)
MGGTFTPETVRHESRRPKITQSRLERSDATIHHALASYGASPSERASRREQAVLLANAVSELPSDYREVFVQRTLEHVPFEDVAVRMGRSVGAVRMLWARALERLNRLMEQQA